MTIDLFCIASGPSLTAEDCETVRKTGVDVMAVNNSWEMAPFCDYIYAGDYKWWATHINHIALPAEKWTCSKKARQKFGIRYHQAGGSFNSGMRAIQWGIAQGYRGIALLGYDCSVENGLHWHGPHTEELLKNPNKKKVGKWHEQFARAARQAERYGVEVFNCSRKTDLTCFPKITLETAVSIASLSTSMAGAKKRGCSMRGHWA